VRRDATGSSKIAVLGRNASFFEHVVFRGAARPKQAIM